MSERRLVTVTLHFLEDEHKALSVMKDGRKQTWEPFILGMARETGEYCGP
jgi:hypothetical protein